MNIFTAVKYCCILHGCVFVMDWLTPEIRDLMKERNKCKINGNMDAYKRLRNKVSKQIEIAKKNTYQSKIEEGRSDPKSI